MPKSDSNRYDPLGKQLPLFPQNLASKNQIANELLFLQVLKQLLISCWQAWANNNWCWVQVRTSTKLVPSPNYKWNMQHFARRYSSNVSQAGMQMVKSWRNGAASVHSCFVQEFGHCQSSSIRRKLHQNIHDYNLTTKAVVQPPVTREQDIGNCLQIVPRHNSN